MALSESFLPLPDKPRRGRPRREAVTEAPVPAPAPAAPEVSSLPSALSATPPSPPPTKQTAEIAQVEVRHGLPVYVASQRKLLYPNHVYPVIVDHWVDAQLRLPNGALRRV